MKLVSVYRRKDAGLFLYRLLAERPAYANISHHQMPTLRKHLMFVRSRPYKAWYLIEQRRQFIGAVYLSRHDEIGVSILPEYRHHGFAQRSIAALIKHHRRPRYLANIAPYNTPSHLLFSAIGFTPIQHTYELIP